MPISRARRGGQYFCIDLPHADDGFVKAYPAETAEAFCLKLAAGVGLLGMVGLVCAGRWLEIGGLAAVVVGSLAVYALMKRF